MDKVVYRAFFALSIPGHIIEKVIEFTQAFESNLSNLIRWVRPEHIHITLNFLPELDKQHIFPIKAILVNSLLDQKKFELTIRGLGVFPNYKNPRVFWLGLDGHDQIMQIHQSISEISHGFGYPKENRSFSPHLTIGRLKKTRDKESLQNLTEYIKNLEYSKIEIFSIDHLALFKSELTPRGPKYAELFRIPFSD